MDDSVVRFPLSKAYAEPFESIARGCLLIAQQRELGPKELFLLVSLAQALRQLPLPVADLHVEASLSRKYPSSSGTLTVVVGPYEVSVMTTEGFDSGAGWDHETRTVIDVEIEGFDSRDDVDSSTIAEDLWRFTAEWVRWAEDSECQFEITGDIEDAFWKEPKPERWEGLERDA